MTRMVVMGNFLCPIVPSTPMGIQGVACVMNGADTLVYQDHDAPPIIARRLVDGHVPTMSS
jgi:hypothetical protein